jgi:hypothetical protein
MTEIKALSGFYKAIAADCRISTTHISLYMALFQCWNENLFENPVAFTSGEIMPMAKIDSRATYHKCLRDLVEYGYIRYTPSCNPFLKSMVWII